MCCSEQSGVIADPPSCPPITVTTTAPAGTPPGWQLPGWGPHELEFPTCPFGPNASKVVNSHTELTQTAVVSYLWPPL